MDSVVSKLVRAVPQLVANPRRATALLFRRLLPITIVLEDPEVYNVVGSRTFGKLTRRTLREIFPGIESEDVTIARAFDRDTHTSASVQEVVALSAICRRKRPRRVLEVGTARGNTTLNLAANSPADATITTIDLPPDWDGVLVLDVPRPAVNATANVGVQARMTDHANKIRQVYGDSAKIPWAKLPGPFDLIFIDGCHHYTYAKSDSVNAVACAAPGAVIVWHDYGMIEDVSRAVDEMAGQMPISALAGSRLAIGFPGA